MRSKRVALLVLASLFAVIVVSGCSRPDGQARNAGEGRGALQVKGSDTMVNLGAAWAEAYMEEHPRSNIAVTGGGSGTGISAMIDGTTDIAQTSRAMKAEEIELARERGVNPVEHVVATDALSVIVNRKNPVSKLTISQLSDIYTGKVTNWKQLGGPDMEIVVLSREKNSGTHVFFLEYVVRQGDEKGPEEFAKSALMMPSSELISTQVARDEGSIGYVGLGYADPAKHRTIAVANDDSGPFVEPSLETALNGTYPIARPMYWYTRGEPRGEVKSFLEFATSDKGQRMVEELGFAPIRKV